MRRLRSGVPEAATSGSPLWRSAPPTLAQMDKQHEGRPCENETGIGDHGLVRRAAAEDHRQMARHDDSHRP